MRTLACAWQGQPAKEGFGLDSSLAMALGSMVLTAVTDLIYKRSMALGARPTSFLVTQSLFFNAGNWLWGLTSASLELTPALLLYGPLAGLVSYTARMMFLTSLKRGDPISINAPIFRLSFVVTAVLAIGLSGESLRPGKLAGMVLAALAVVALLEPPRAGGAPGLRGARPLAFGTVLLGLYGWIQKLSVVAGVSPASLLVVQGSMYLSIAIPSARLSSGLRPNRVELLHAPIGGTLSSVAFLLLLYSLQSGEASVNIPIYQLSFVFTALLAGLFLGERLNLRKLLGLLAAALAVAVFNLRA